MGKDNIYWVDGEFLPASEVKIPVGDLAFTRGYAGFDAARTYQRWPFLLDQHIERFFGTCEGMWMQVPVSRQELRKIVLDTVEKSTHKECLIRFYLTGGLASGFIPEPGRQSLLVMVDEMKGVSEELLQGGIRLFPGTGQRNFPAIKSTDYHAAVMNTIVARQQGFHEMIFLNDQNGVLEGSTFNFGVWANEVAVIPEAEVLEGLTMKFCLELLNEAGVKVERRSVTLDELKDAEEVFITSSTRELLPVVQVGDVQIGSGKPGDWVRNFLEKFQQKATQRCLEEKEKGV